MVNRERVTKDNGFDKVEICNVIYINELDVVSIAWFYYNNILLGDNYCC
jgi:hypothetical protein